MEISSNLSANFPIIIMEDVRRDVRWGISLAGVAVAEEHVPQPKEDAWSGTEASLAVAVKEGRVR